MYYLCSDNKGADQLRGYREADLRLCLSICKKRFSHNEAHYINTHETFAFLFENIKKVQCNRISAPDFGICDKGVLLDNFRVYYVLPTTTGGLGNVNTFIVLPDKEIPFS